jgi:hypothetical protein
MLVQPAKGHPQTVGGEGAEKPVGPKILAEGGSVMGFDDIQVAAEGLRSLLRLCRETVVRLGKSESALVRSLQRDRLLVETCGAPHDHSGRWSDHGADLGAGSG